MKFFTKFRKSIAVAALSIMLMFGFVQVPQARADDMMTWVGSVMQSWQSGLSVIPAGVLVTVGSIIVMYLIALWTLWYQTRDTEQFHTRKAQMHAACLADTPDEWEHAVCDPLLDVQPPAGIF